MGRQKRREKTMSKTLQEMGLTQIEITTQVILEPGVLADIEIDADLKRRLDDWDFAPDEDTDGNQKRYFSDDEMLQKSQFFAIGAIGGMTEGFGYAECQALCQYWGRMRRECEYNGGFVREVTGAEAVRLQKELERG